MAKKMAVSRSAGKYYSRTSEAWSLNSLAAYEYSRRAKAQNPVYKKKLRFQNKIVFVDAGQTKAKVSALTLVTVALVFLCALGLALSCAFILNRQLEISSLTSELKAKREQNMIAEADISQSYDLAEIERIATTKLGMSKPKAYQIVHINVPKQDYVIRQNTEAASKTKSLSLMDKLASFVP